jgi:hypothetical protein
MKADRSRITILDFAGLPPYADGGALASAGGNGPSRAHAQRGSIGRANPAWSAGRFDVRNASCVVKADQDALLAGLESCSSLDAFNDWMHELLCSTLSKQQNV